MPNAWELRLTGTLSLQSCWSWLATAHRNFDKFFYIFIHAIQLKEEEEQEVSNSQVSGLSPLITMWSALTEGNAVDRSFLGLVFLYLGMPNGWKLRQTWPLSLQSCNFYFATEHRNFDHFRPHSFTQFDRKRRKNRKFMSVLLSLLFNPQRQEAMLWMSQF